MDAANLAEDLLARIIYGIGTDWSEVLASGWPIFRLAARVLELVPAGATLSLLGTSCEVKFNELNASAHERESRPEQKLRLFDAPVEEVTLLNPRGLPPDRRAWSFSAKRG